MIPLLHALFGSLMQQNEKNHTISVVIVFSCTRISKRNELKVGNFGCTKTYK